MIGLDNHYSINKTNFAIEVSNNLTILQRKIFNHALFEQDSQGWDTPIIKLQFRDINALIGNSTHRQNHNKIKSIFKQLLTKELKIVNAKYLGYEATCYISYVKICDKHIEVKIDEELKKHLNINYINEQGIKNTSKGYVNLNLEIVNRLHSTYHIALYEFLTKSWHEQRQKKEICIDVNLLTEISSNKKSYKQYKEFQRTILKPAIEEININTNLNIEYEQIKYAGKVEKICFRISNFEKKAISHIQQVKNVINAVIEPVKVIFKPEKAEYPQLAQKLLDKGVKPVKFALECVKQDADVVNAIIYEIETTKPDIHVNGNFGGLFRTKWQSREIYRRKIDAKLEQHAQKQEEKQKEIIIAKESQIQQKQKQQRQSLIEEKAQEFKAVVEKKQGILGELWASIEKHIDVSITVQQKRTWFDCAWANIKNNVLEVYLPNRQKIDFFKRNLLSIVEKITKELNYSLHVKVDCYSLEHDGIAPKRSILI